MKNRLYRLVSGLVLLVPLVGCGPESVDLGDNDQDAGEGPTLAGTWVGSLTSQAFLTNPRTVRLEIDAAGHGTFLVGDTPPLPPPTDPAVGYPPEAQADAGDATGLLLHLYEGIVYPTQEVHVDGTSLSFTANMIQAFDPWCRLQTPVQGTGRCRDFSGLRVERDGGKRCYKTNPDASRAEEEDCLAAYLCGFDHTKGCLCTATECTAGVVASNYSADSEVTFDLELDDDDVLRGELSAFQVMYTSQVELFRQSQE